MPFEVYPVAPMHDAIAKIPTYRSLEARTQAHVAEEIKRRYDDVAERGGAVVASHTVEYSGAESAGYTFLVAEFPGDLDLA